MTPRAIHCPSRFRARMPGTICIKASTNHLRWTIAASNRSISKRVVIISFPPASQRRFRRIRRSPIRIHSETLALHPTHLVHHKTSERSNPTAAGPEAFPGGRRSFLVRRAATAEPYGTPPRPLECENLGKRSRHTCRDLVVQRFHLAVEIGHETVATE